ncbi:MAG: hypothetical protein PHW96_03775 [Candidatus Nanoarchaeia archaeon]|nr:hypothetical protein [Candidatus Nanoarchaeia archaeon]
MKLEYKLIIGDLLREFYMDEANKYSVMTPLSDNDYFEPDAVIPINNRKPVKIPCNRDGIPMPSKKSDRRFIDIEGGVPDKMAFNRSVNSYGLFIKILNPKQPTSTENELMDEILNHRRPLIYFGSIFDAIHGFAGILGKKGMDDFYRFDKGQDAKKKGEKKDFTFMIENAKKHQNQNHLFSDNRDVRNAGIYCSNAGNLQIKSFSQGKEYTVTPVGFPKIENGTINIEPSIFRTSCTCDFFKNFYNVTHENALFVAYDKHIDIASFGVVNGKNAWTNKYAKKNVFEGLVLKDKIKNEKGDLEEILVDKGLKNRLNPYSPLMQNDKNARELGAYGLMLKYANYESSSKSSHFKRHEIDLILGDYWELEIDKVILYAMVKNMLSPGLRSIITADYFNDIATTRVASEDVIVPLPSAVVDVIYNREHVPALIGFMPMRGPR